MKFAVLVVAAISGVALAAPQPVTKPFHNLTPLHYSKELPVADKAFHAPVDVNKREADKPTKDNRKLSYSHNLPKALKGKYLPSA